MESGSSVEQPVLLAAEPSSLQTSVWILFIFETGSSYIPQSGFELTELHLTLPLEYPVTFNLKKKINLLMLLKTF